MQAEITALAPFGLPMPAPGLAAPIAAGPLVTLAFTLALGGPVPNVIGPPAPQSCQVACPNVALQVAVVDQNGDPVDLSGAAGLLLWLLAPDGTAVPVPGFLVTNGMDGLLQYVTTAQDLALPGTWGIQAQLTFGSRQITTRLAYFGVEANVADL